MGQKPLVSVIMPVFNCRRYLAEAIESALAQTYTPLEVVVVDDGSTDGSAEVATRYASGVRFDRQPHRGIAVARNRAVSLARGEFLAFQDADDIWQEDGLTDQMAAFHRTPEADMLFGHVSEFISPELNDEAARRIECHEEPMPSMGPGAIIKAEAFRTVGPFATEWLVGEFMDWHLRARDLGLKSLMQPQVILKRRLHNTNQSVRQRGSRLDFVHILKASLDRRRRADGVADPG